MLSEFTGRAVSCTPRPRFRSSSARRVYGIYSDLATHETILLRADLPLIANMAGSRAGFDGSLLCDRIKATQIDTTLREAIHELLSKASTEVSGGRRVSLNSVCMDTAYLTGPARSVLNFPSTEISFDVCLDGHAENHTRGDLTIFTEA